MELYIDKIISGGSGLGRDHGKVIFVEGALPGERVSVTLIEEKKGYSRAHLNEILEPSIHRRAPFCSSYGSCGGCTLQHLDYTVQLQEKTNLVRESFKRIGKIEVDQLIPHSADDRAYRSRVQLHKTSRGCGFRKRNSSLILDIEDCPVCTPGINEFLQSSSSLTGRIQKERFHLFSSEKGLSVEGIQDEAEAVVLGKSFFFRADLFFQSNLILLPQLIEWVLNHAEGKTAADLYCGVGLFSAFLLDSGFTVTSLEGNDRVEPYLKKNLKGNYSFYLQNLETWNPGTYRPDLVLIDPPRTGISKKAMNVLLSLRPKKLLYISCNPDTMARDSAILIDHGARLNELTVFDFYPHTAHIEAAGEFLFPENSASFHIAGGGNG